MRFVTLFLAALSLPAQVIQQIGPHWVATYNGSAQINTSGELYVESQGPVTVRGVPGDRISYTVTRSTRAFNEDAARAILLTGAIKVIPTPSGTRIGSLGALDLKVPQQMRLVIVRTMNGGAIDVTDLDGQIDLQASYGRIHADGIKGSMTARTGAGAIKLGKIGGAIDCYTAADSISIDNAGGAVNCQTAGGEIVLKEAAGTVRLFSGGGNIFVGHAGATVEAHADQGSIQIGQAGGPVIADNAQGGSIQVGSAMGVRAQSAGGMVRVTGDLGPIDVATAVGNILAELMAGVAMKESSLTASSGDIIVRIPSNLRVTIMAFGGPGGRPHLVSDFSEVQAQPFFSRSPRIVQGAINGGGPILKINDPRGSIQLVRVK